MLQLQPLGWSRELRVEVLQRKNSVGDSAIFESNAVKCEGAVYKGHGCVCDVLIHGKAADRLEKKWEEKKVYIHFDMKISEKTMYYGRA